MKTRSINLPNNNIARIASATALILLIPLVAMQFTSEVNWNLFDFIVMGALIFGTGLVYELVSKRLQSKNQKIIFAVLVLLGFLYIWAELAVGVFTSIGS